jgi:hypothetical protein
MPHDKNGTPLKAGDTVTIVATVREIQTSPDYCNMTVETVEPMHPSKNLTAITLNCRQVERVGGTGEVAKSDPKAVQEAAERGFRSK